MVSPSRLFRLLALTAVLLLAPTALAAATPAPTYELQYHPGGTAPEYGPNSFVITVGDCPPIRYVDYKWGSHHGKISAPCGETTISSLAPLGVTEHPLQWRSCSVTQWRYPPRLHTVCGDYHYGVVLTD
ncbi:hypothetical protein A6A25_24055 [Saccharothrix sp. CB00851]|nr:hypothetical protein A6A25_24055 [Saccharothrix sp. CB00851]